MDQRLFRVAGTRPNRLLNSDIPAVAHAIVAVIRRQATVDRHVIKDVPCIRIYGTGVDVLVRADDWIKVLPFLKDGTFDPWVVPVSQIMVFNRNAHYEAPTLDRNDAELYRRVVNALSPLFPVDFPKENP